ncbi:MAG: TetR family transcriptional regulator [Gammaproteobacteria bacterium]|nr:TetR family transcriptional regulator [Gammaproteobacteria bacterium]
MARRSEHSRDEIQAMAIQAAITILSEQGLQGLSTRKVASAIGYTAGTLYLVFKNLDELILQVNAASLDELHVWMQDALAKNKAPQAQLLGLAHAYLSFARENFARWSLMFTHQMPVEMHLPDWFHDKVRTLFALVVKPLQQINASLTLEQYRQATHVLWSSVHGVCELGLNDKLALGGEIQAEELIDAMVKNFLNGFSQGWE